MKNGLPSATYRLNVNTSSAAGNLNVGAENLFSIWAKSLGNARVFGGGRMAAYTNLDGGLQKFYFAQIEKVHAGKTMAIHLFDPGEASGNAYLRILSPDGNIYHYQTFDWTSDDGRSATGVSQIQTAVNGAAQFNNREITITIPLPATLRQGRPQPAGRRDRRRGLVADRVQRQPGQRHHDLVGRHPRQPGPPGAAVMGHADPDRGMFDPTRPDRPLAEASRHPVRDRHHGGRGRVRRDGRVRDVLAGAPGLDGAEAQRGGVGWGIGDAEAGALAIAQSSLTRPAR